MPVNTKDFSKDAVVAAKPKKKAFDLSATAAQVAASRNGTVDDIGLAAMFNVDTNVATATGIQQIPLSQLTPYSQPELGFAEQPFKVLDNEEMHELVADIKENGIYQALIVRPTDNGYMILAGHRRFRAAERAGLETVPCVVKDVDDNMAAMIVVQTNLLHRQKILPSEKAFAYKLRLEAIKRKAGRPGKENSPQIGANLKGKRSDEVLADEMGTSKNQISRHIRLTYLCSNLLLYVDAGSIPVNAGVSLSYLPSPLQKFVCDLLQETGKPMTLELAEQIRNAKPLDEDTIQNIIMPPAKQKKVQEEKTDKPREIKIRFSDISEFLPADVTDSDAIKTIIKALVSYSSHKLD